MTNCLAGSIITIGLGGRLSWRPIAFPYANQGDMMPIPKKWSRFTRAKIRKIPGVRGVYELANQQKKQVDRGGSDASTGVRGRLLQRLRDKKPPTAKYFRYQAAAWLDSGIDMEAEHADRFRKKHGRDPRYTRRSPRKRELF